MLSNFRSEALFGHPVLFVWFDYFTNILRGGLTLTQLPQRSLQLRTSILTLSGFVSARLTGFFTDVIFSFQVSIVCKDTESQHQYELYLEDIPLQVSGAPVTRRLLEEFSGNNVEGYSIGLSQKELVRLESSIVYLDIWDMIRGQSLMRTRWDKVTLFEALSAPSSGNRAGHSLLVSIPITFLFFP